MACEKCGGKVDEVSKNIFFCRECGARQTTPELQKPTGLLNLVIVLNYVVGIFIVIFGLFFLFAFGIIYFEIFYFIIIIIPFFMVGILFWANAGLKKFDSSQRKNLIILYILIIILIFIGFSYISIFLPAFLLIMIGLHYYVLYVHKPTVELFK